MIDDAVWMPGLSHPVILNHVLLPALPCRQPNSPPPVSALHMSLLTQVILIGMNDKCHR